MGSRRSDARPVAFPQLGDGDPGVGRRARRFYQGSAGSLRAHVTWRGRRACAAWVTCWQGCPAAKGNTVCNDACLATMSPSAANQAGQVRPRNRRGAVGLAPCECGVWPAAIRCAHLCNIRGWTVNRGWTLKASVKSQCLVAYVVPSGPRSGGARVSLTPRKTLPNGSAPAAIMVIDEIPVTGGASMPPWWGCLN